MFTAEPIAAPVDRKCWGTHHLVPTGATFRGQPVRFMRVRTDGGAEIIVCEPCLVVAKKLAKGPPKSRCCGRKG